MLRLPQPLSGRTWFGPFRDRAPERAALNFLQDMGTGKCTLSSQGVQLFNTTCAKEALNPIESLILTNRSQQPDSVKLKYVWANSEIALSDDDWLEIELTNKSGVWRVITYDRIF